jgi:hypothetical protein
VADGIDARAVVQSSVFLFPMLMRMACPARVGECVLAVSDGVHGVRLAGRIVWAILVLVMRIMDVRMRVFDGFVLMFVVLGGV